MAQKLTSAQRKKFEAQAAHAKRIMDNIPTSSEGVISKPGSYQLAERARQRALKMLGRGGESFPNKSDSADRPKRKGSLSDGVRAVVEIVKRASPTTSTKKLEEVRKKAGGK